MDLLKAIKFNLGNLINFRGRETRGQFWPYAAFVFALFIIGMMAVMVPEILSTIGRMQQFAVEHPELATIEQGPGSYSIQIEGNHPELMPDMGHMMGVINALLVIIVVLLAAAVARRLHDRGKSAAWGLLPLPFVTFAFVMMPKVFTLDPLDMSLFFTLFINNMLYLGALAWLIILLTAESDDGANRYGAAPLR